MKGKQLLRVIIALIILASLRCTDIYDPILRGTITVLVHWDDFGIRDKKVELLQTGEVKKTNEKGLAEFTVKPGSYTIRVYDVNKGRPCCAFIDLKADVKANESIVLDVVDCLPCV